MCRNTSETYMLLYDCKNEKCVVTDVMFLLYHCSVTLHFKFPDGSRKSAKANIGENILDAVLSNNLDIDGYGMLSISAVKYKSVLVTYTSTALANNIEGC